MSATKLNFIIPVRHHLSVKDWRFVKENMQRTFHSIMGQTSNNWHCYVVANIGADLPALSEHFTRIDVEFPLNNLPKKDDDPDLYHELVRLDKGLRVYEAVKKCHRNDFFMVVDYDDFVSNALAEYVSRNRESLGWFISSGYLYSGGALALKHRRFDDICGTSNIVKVAFLEHYYDEQGNLPVEQIKRLLGSHRFIKADSKATSLVYDPLPFPGAIYNVGIQGSTSQTPSILKGSFSLKLLFSNPLAAVKILLRLRLFTSTIKRKFTIV